jgi:hypothetical protein
MDEQQYQRLIDAKRSINNQLMVREKELQDLNNAALMTQEPIDDWLVERREELTREIHTLEFQWIDADHELTEFKRHHYCCTRR